MNTDSIILVSCLVFRENRVLLVRNSWATREGWTFPCGHVEKMEDLRSAAARELREETGLECNIPPEFRFVVHVLRTNQPSLLNFFFSASCNDSAQLLVADPSNVVVDAEFVPVKEAIHRLIFPDLQQALVFFQSGMPGGPLIACHLAD